ncbi:MAG: hypothetical protein JSU01_10405 [Bacteroidetes bacterium]|nr:hypothetical protein [Bacteroidota bacterium]
MKKTAYLICFAPLLLIFSCSHEKMCCVMPQPGTVVTAQKDGESWNDRYASGTLSTADTLSVSAVSATIPTPGVVKKTDTLNIKILYTNPGTYQLKSDQVFYGTFGNNSLTSYQLDGSYNNVINITGYQRLSNPYSTVPDQIKITGTFSLKFIDPNNPSGISFQNGSFYTLVPYL